MRICSADSHYRLSYTTRYRIPPILGSDQDNPLSDPVARLRMAFSNEIDDLKNALGTTHILPELSEPTGNGVAYDKFLTIYNEMQTPRVPLDITSSTERLETKA